MEKILDAALKYARRGWFVFPLNGKKPFAGSHGHKEATLDEVQIRAWWEKWPHANVGIQTGTNSGIFVIDVDGPTGELTLTDKKLAFGDLPVTYKVTTRSDDRYHLYFEQPPGVRTKNQASDEEKLGLGIDVRGDGGYVVGAPSIHPETGKPYRVVVEMLPAKPMQWVLDFVLVGEVKKTRTGQVPQHINRGNRDAALTRIAGQMRWLGLDEPELLKALKEINVQRCKPALDEKDIERISKSIGSKPASSFSAAGVLNEQELVAKMASDIQPKPITWRWMKFLPRGGIVVWGGDPGHGKSTMSLTIAAAITNGTNLPGDLTNEVYAPEHVIILSAEDDADTVIIPRLMVAGADLKMVSIIEPMMSDGRPALLPAHLDKLAAKINETKAGLVIIDPLDSFLGGEIDSYKNADVRRALSPIQAMAHRTQAIILVLGHLNKSTTASAMQRFSGSGAFIAAPRVSFAFGASQEFEGEAIFACVKNNLASKPSALRFLVEETHLPGVGKTARIKWMGESTETADSTLMVAQPMNGETKLTIDAAKDFLKEFLSDGPHNSREVYHEALTNKVCAEKTLRRAQEALGIKSRQKGREWFMALPGHKWANGNGDLFEKVKEKGEL